MCKWGTDTDIMVRIPSNDSYTGKTRLAIKGVDSCMADLVQKMVMGGVQTVGCCCGHGNSYPDIGLEDGNYLVMIPRDDYIRIWQEKFRDHFRHRS